jgi:uncharacterized membrane protein
LSFLFTKEYLSLEIRNKIQGFKSTLDLLLAGEKITKKFLKMSKKDLNRAIELLNEEQERNEI